jgi:selenocysteine lyase/cysteine desulfurase
MANVEYLIESIPEHAWQVSRRDFIRRLAGGLAAAGVLGAGANAAASPLKQMAEKTAGLGKSDMGDERFWLAVKDQFILKEGLAVMNAANLCPSPYPVMETVFHYTRDVDTDASFFNRDKFGTLQEAARSKLAALLGATPDEIAIVRNTSEANNVISTGFVLKEGDEILLSDLNHTSNRNAWEVKARRYGFKINYASFARTPKSHDEIIKAFRDALTPRTKLMSFTHVSNVTGVLMPAKALCALGHEHGLFVHVDGAQSFGALRINLADMGCDSYSGSAHKWFMGPKEAGVLYVRKERQNDVWPSIVSVPWRDDIVGARKYEALGQRDDGAVAAVGRTVDFHMILGPDRVEARMRQVAAAIMEGLSKLPGVELTTSMDPALSAGVVIFKPGALDARKVYERLYTSYQIAGAGMGPNIRLSPHIYNTLSEADRVIAAVSEMLKNGV